MKFAHIADIHLGNMQYGSLVRWNDFADAWMETCRYLSNQDIELCIIAGDLFHHRVIDPETLSVAIAGLEYFKYKSIPVVAVEGNHEQPRRDTDVGWLGFLENESLLWLLDSRMDKNFHCDDLSIYGLPWCGAATKSELQNLRIIDPHAFKILVLHGGIDTGYAGSFSKEDIPPEIDYVALGHIHKPSIDPPFYNPGSLETCNVEEAAWNDRGALIMDTDTNVIELFTPKRRKFRQIDVYSSATIDVNDDEIVHVYVHKDVAWKLNGSPIKAIIHKKYETTRKQVKGDIEAIEQAVLKSLPQKTQVILDMALNKRDNDEIVGEL